VTGTEIIGQARKTLVEGTAFYWTDAELLIHLNLGIKDLWRAISDNFQDYFFAVSEAVTFAANATTLSNVPANVAKVASIEPVDQEAYPSMKFFPRAFNSADAQTARAQAASDPSQLGPVFYSLTGAGAPVGAPTIYAAPKTSATVSLRMSYTPTTPTIVAADANPVPGESDDALIAWVIAHGLAREREDRKPDPDWIAKYSTEKQNILTFLSPRQNDEPDVAEGVHEPWING
jgi:hypothetical protein